MYLGKYFFIPNKTAKIVSRGLDEEEHLKRMCGIVCHKFGSMPFLNNKFVVQSNI